MKKFLIKFNERKRATQHINFSTPRSLSTDHDYISDDRNDDFDGVNRNHAFDNDFDLDMHEPGD